MSDLYVVAIILGIFLCSTVGLMHSENKDIEMAKAGLQQCYVSNHSAPIWMKECPK